MFDELDESSSRKAYNSWLKNEEYNDICSRVNRELTDILLDFCVRYGIILKKWSVNAEHYQCEIDSISDDSVKGNTDVHSYIEKLYKGLQFYETLYSNVDIMRVIERYVKDNTPSFNTLNSLYKVVLNDFFLQWKKSLRYYQSFEYFSEDMKSNEIEFYKNGSVYYGSE